MTRPNDDLTAEPLDDEEIAHLETQLRRDVLHHRPLWLGLLARMRVAEKTLADVRAQPKRDELAREVKRLEGDNAKSEMRCAESTRRVLHVEAATERLMSDLDGAQRLMAPLEASVAVLTRELAAANRDLAAAQQEAQRLRGIPARWDAERVAHAATRAESDGLLRERAGFQERLRVLENGRAILQSALLQKAAEQDAAVLARIAANAERDTGDTQRAVLQARVAELEADEDQQRLRETIQVLEERNAVLKAKLQRLEAAMVTG